MKQVWVEPGNFAFSTNSLRPWCWWPGAHILRITDLNAESWGQWRFVLFGLLSRELKTEAKFPGPGVCLGDNTRKPWEEQDGRVKGRKWKGGRERRLPWGHLPPSGVKSLYEESWETVLMMPFGFSQWGWPGITSPRNWSRAFSVLHLWPTQTLTQGMATPGIYSFRCLKCRSRTAWTQMTWQGADRHCHDSLLGADVLAEINDPGREF